VGYIREDQADIRVTLDGIAMFGSWKSIEGGDLETDDAKTRPGGMGRMVSLGGPVDRNDLTATIQFSDVVSLKHKAFEAACGNGRVKVAVTWLGPDRAPTGTSFSRVGTLKGCSVPDADSESSDPGMYTIVVACDELAA